MWASRRNSFATWFFDYDNDGWPDLFVAGYSLEESTDVGAFELGLPVHAELPKLYRNRHDGTFEDVSAAVHLDRVLLTMGASFGDLNNDGWLDVYLGTGDSTYRCAAAEPHVFERRREAVRGCDDGGRLRAFAEGARGGVCGSPPDGL